MAEQWPVFICYRQSDGMPTARRLYELLRGLTLPVVADSGETGAPPELDVYFDQAAPGVEDWKSIHEPYLKRARAMIVICSPGARLIEGDDDWVHQEINWWLANREVAPILVDPIGDASRYVPEAILRKYPDAQRIRVIENEWIRYTPDELKSANERLVAQLVGGIVPSGRNFFKQEFEEEQRRVAELNDALVRQRSTSRRLGWALGAMSALVVLAAVSTVYAFIKTGEAENARISAETALEDLRVSSLRNSVLSAQQYLARRDYGLAIETAAPLRAEAARPGSPIAAEAAAIDRVIIHAANNLVASETCSIDPDTLAMLHFAPDGTALYAVLRDYAIVRWTLPGCAGPEPVYQHPDTLAGVAFGRDAMASASWDRTLRLESGSGAVTIARLASGNGRIARIGYGAGGGPLTVGTNRGDIFNVEAVGDGFRETPVALPAGASAIGLAGNKIVIDLAGSVGFVAADTGVLSGPFPVPASNSGQAIALADGERYALIQNDREVWLLGPGDAARTLGQLGSGLDAISLAPDDSAVVAYNDDAIAYLPPDGAPASTHSPFPADITYAGAAGAGLFVAAAEDDTIRLIDAVTGDLVWQGVQRWLVAANPVLAPDASRLAFPMRPAGVMVRGIITSPEAGIALYCRAAPPGSIACADPVQPGE